MLLLGIVQPPIWSNEKASGTLNENWDGLGGIQTLNPKVEGQTGCEPQTILSSAGKTEHRSFQSVLAEFRWFPGVPGSRLLRVSMNGESLSGC